jgi:hypothetical protein
MRLPVHENNRGFPVITQTATGCGKGFVVCPVQLPRLRADAFFRSLPQHGRRSRNSHTFACPAGRVNARMYPYRTRPDCTATCRPPPSAHPTMRFRSEAKPDPMASNIVSGNAGRFR